MNKLALQSELIFQIIESIVYLISMHYADLFKTLHILVEKSPQTFSYMLSLLYRKK